MSQFSRNTRIASLAAIGALFAAGAATAGVAPVKLSGAQETPPVTTSAKGTSTIRVHADKTVSGAIKVAGMSATAAHIHEGEAGMSGPPIIPLDKASATTFKVPAGAKLTDEQYASYQAGKLYVNVHSAAHPDGEIRAQLGSK